MADKGQQYEQLNISGLLNMSAVSNASSSDLTSLIGRLQLVQREKEREERAEWERMARIREEERCRRAKEEQEERERLEKKRKEQHIRDVTSMELALDWENFYATDETVAQNRVESIPDGFIKCLNAKGCVDIEYIAAISGSDCKTVIERLKGSIFQNPDNWGECFYKGWETAEEYLSGNVRKKLSAAKTANEEYSGYFETNVKALEKVIPQRVCAEDIYVALGSPWVPPKYLTQFVRELREEKIERKQEYNYFLHEYVNVPIKDIFFSHDTETGTWECSDPKFTDWAFDQKYGTSARSAMDIILRTLNPKVPSFYTKDYVGTGTSISS